MVKNRIVYLFFLGAAIAFAYLYPGNVSSAFFYAILFIPIVSFAYTAYIYIRFNYIQSVDKKFITKGDMIQFNIVIANETFILYPYVEILFYGVDTIFTKHFRTKKIAVLPNTTGTYKFELECQYRGYYEMGLREIRIKDFLGFFSFKYKIFEPKYVTVYPRIIALDTFPIHANKLESVEGLLDAREEDRMTLSDIRKYAYGDSIKKIHWKLSAKKNQIMVKNFDGTVTNGATIILDLTKNDYGVVENTILEDKVVEVSVAIINYCLSHHIETCFIYHEEEMICELATDYSHFERFYKALFKIKFKSDTPFEDTVKIALAGDLEKNSIVLITSNLNDEIYSQIGSQHDLGYETILVYVSPEELLAENENRQQESKAILSALQEMNVRAYAININDDIKYVLEC